MGLKEERFIADKQQKNAVASCDKCGFEVYRGELVHRIDGRIICPDCFFDFAFDYFAESLVLAEETQEDR